MEKAILAINPGSTSTKIAVFKGKEKVFSESIEHSEAELARYDTIYDQLGFRTEMVRKALEHAALSANLLDGEGGDANTANSMFLFDAVVGRGGMIAPIGPGGYIVDDALIERLSHEDTPPHASNLGALIASAIATPMGIPAFIYDAVGADEMADVAHVTGLPEIVRKPFSHVLNTRAMARKYAENAGKRYEDMNFLVCHIGGGVSVNVHEKGRIVDSIEDDGGPFSMERAGVIPLSYIVDMAYSGEYTKKELMKKLRGMGGVKAHLGTHDLREVEKRIEEGDEKAALIHDALAYQISKGIGELAPVLKGNYDAIILTGGAAYSAKLTTKIKERVAFIAPVAILPGENEMEALALGCLRVLRGEENAKRYEP